MSVSLSIGRTWVALITPSLCRCFVTDNFAGLIVQYLYYVQSVYAILHRLRRRAFLFVFVAFDVLSPPPLQQPPTEQILLNFTKITLH